MEEYLNKLYKGKNEPKRVSAEDHPEKKYCSNFIKGEDGYCINYIKPEALVSKAKISEKEFIDIKVYEPAAVNCFSQCKKQQ